MGSEWTLPFSLLYLKLTSRGLSTMVEFSKRAKPIRSLAHLCVDWWNYLVEICELEALEKLWGCQDPSYEKKTKEKLVGGVYHQSWSVPLIIISFTYMRTVIPEDIWCRNVESPFCSVWIHIQIELVGVFRRTYVVLVSGPKVILLSRQTSCFESPMIPYWNFIYSSFL